MSLVWHQIATIGMAVIFAINAASQSYLAGLFAFAAVLAITWGYLEANAKDAARVERDDARRQLRREHEARVGVRR